MNRAASAHVVYGLMVPPHHPTVSSWNLLPCFLCRSAPLVNQMYQLEGTPADLRRMVMLQFRRNGEVADPRIVDMLLTKSEMEFEETLNQWKQRGHLMYQLDPELPAPETMTDSEDFFRRFLNGSLTSKDVWMDWSRRDQLKTLRSVAADPEAQVRVSREDLAKWARRWSSEGTNRAPAQLK